MGFSLILLSLRDEGTNVTKYFMDSELYIPSTGLVQDPVDNRDLPYAALVGTQQEGIDWKKGYNVYDALKMKRLVMDQGPSYSCVGQATAEHARAVWFKITGGQNIEFSRKFIYSNISLGYGVGANLRDGVKFFSEFGSCREESLPSYQDLKPPSESYMVSKASNTPALFAEALPFDQFNYRMIPGGTTDINLFAHAIQNNQGMVGGFTGTNEGWMNPMIRVPRNGEAKWGHAIFLAGFGMYQDKKCLFTPNSWGGRYTIQDGPWKGFQAIPEDYFLAAVPTAVGSVPGAYVFNGWVMVNDVFTPPNVKLMDFLQKNEGKLVQNAKTGEFGLVVGGKIRNAPRGERLTELLSTYLMRKEGVVAPEEIWNDAPKQNV